MSQTQNPIKIAVVGAAGRMGRRILTLAAENPAFEIVGALEVEDSNFVGHSIGSVIGFEGVNVRIVSDASKAFEKADVAIDFSAPSSTLQHVETASKLGCRVVIGTTGFNEAQKSAIHEFSQKIAVVMAPNMSLGVNLLFKMVSKVSQALNDEYDIEIIEAHHKHKKDHPSGTALELAKRAAEGRGLDFESEVSFGRLPDSGERAKGSIYVHAIRGGDVVGEHSVRFIADGEEVELFHRATSRDAFAKGALKAAAYVSTQKHGFFTMQDVLQI